MSCEPGAASACDHTVVLIVAAGYSRRFGGRDKRLARLANGQTLLAASLASMAEDFQHRRVIVREGDDVTALGLPADTQVYRARNAAEGQGASMADGVRALLEDKSLERIKAAAVWLGDMPHIEPHTLGLLCRQASARDIVRPTWLGRAGHPVVFGRAFWPELAALAGDSGGAEVIRRHRNCYREVAVTDTGVCRDIDTTDDLQRLLDRRPIAP